MCHPPTPQEARRLKRISSRIMRAVRSERFLNANKLRADMVEIAADIELMVAGLMVAGHEVPDEMCAETLRAAAAAREEEIPTIPAPPPDFFEVDCEPEDSAPPVPVLRPSGGP